jgi:molybdopterin-guanine dinucleotide biosynthesis protein A
VGHGSAEPPKSAGPGSPPTPHVQTRTALIFAGGRATRLGGVNKALLEVGGSTIIARILGALGPLVDERVLLANDAALEPQVQDVRLVYDPRPHAGVLPALAAGLEVAMGELCLAVACDMPFVSERLFARMLDLQRQDEADVVIPRSAGYLEPMHAVYRTKAVARAIQAALARGDQRMISYFSDVRVREVAEAEWRDVEPAGQAFFNVNTPDDLAEARRIAAQVSEQA